MYKDDSTIKKEANCERIDDCKVIDYYENKIEYLEKLVKRYKYDSLTGLMGKIDFTDKFNRLFDDNQFGELEFSMALIDINNLHNINRLEGVEKGDQVLIDVAQALKDNFSFHQIYRISGDEFVAICRADVMSQQEMIQKLDTIENISYFIDDANKYSCPKHMFKMLDYNLTQTKTKQKRV